MARHRSVSLALSALWALAVSVSAGAVVPAREAVLDSVQAVRVLREGVLEVAVRLPKGSTLLIPDGATPENYDYRDPSGNVSRSSNGFFSGVRILGVPDAFLPPERIDELNAAPGGLYVSALVMPVPVPEGELPPREASPPGEGFLLHFDADGKPKHSYTSYFRRRFGDRLNLAIDPSSQGEEERAKWSVVFEELRRAADRTRSAPARLLFVGLEEAESASLLFEQDGTVPSFGAWTIAVKSTAPRHGFGHVPCAELVSEFLRQAYRRAGRSHLEDFNADRGNSLVWSSSAAVVRLADALVAGGWIPWDASEHRPVTGAPAMHFKATSPGHAYLIGGDDGRLIVDNGSPGGRDLRATSDRIVRLMYLTGVFFLPPGMVPPRWD